MTFQKGNCANPKGRPRKPLEQRPGHMFAAMMDRVFERLGGEEWMLWFATEYPTEYAKYFAKLKVDGLAHEYASQDPNATPTVIVRHHYPALPNNPKETIEGECKQLPRPPEAQEDPIQEGACEVTTRKISRTKAG